MKKISTNTFIANFMESELFPTEFTPAETFLRKKYKVKEVDFLEKIAEAIMLGEYSKTYLLIVDTAMSYTEQYKEKNITDALHIDALTTYLIKIAVLYFEFLYELTEEKEELVDSIDMDEFFDELKSQLSEPEELSDGGKDIWDKVCNSEYVYGDTDSTTECYNNEDETQKRLTSWMAFSTKHYEEYKGNLEDMWAVWNEAYYEEQN